MEVQVRTHARTHTFIYFQYITHKVQTKGRISVQKFTSSDFDGSKFNSKSTVQPAAITLYTLENHQDHIQLFCNKTIQLLGTYSHNCLLP